MEALPKALKSTQGEYVPTLYSQQGMEGEIFPAAIPVSRYLWTLRRHAWKILAFIFLCSAATYVVSSRLQPLYEAVATVDIDPQEPTAALGPEKQRYAGADTQNYLATQVRLLQSDAVLRPVVLRHNLLQVEGRLDGLTIEQQRARMNEPVKLKRLKVYRVGETFLLHVSYVSPSGQLSADVVNAIAESYLEQNFRARARSSTQLSRHLEVQIEELKAKMEVSRQQLGTFERNLNVINPAEKSSILSNRLLQLNTEYTRAQADRVSKESAWKALEQGATEPEQLGENAALDRLAEKLHEAEETFAVAKAKYGENHPEYAKAKSHLEALAAQQTKSLSGIRGQVRAAYLQAQSREEMMSKAVAEAKAEFDVANQRSFEYDKLKREADSDRALYEELLRKIREATINGSFHGSNIQIADRARPSSTPDFPNIPLHVAIAFLLSSMIAVGAAMIGDVMDNTLRDPERAARMFGIDVIGLLPPLIKHRYPRLGRLDAPIVENGSLLAPAEPMSEKSLRVMNNFEEAVRTLRDAVLLADVQRRVQSVLITSATSGDGKSTVAIYLALANVERGKRTLLIDADMRRPVIAERLNLSWPIGLSDILTGHATWREAVVKPADHPELDVILSGPLSRRAAGVMDAGISDLLDEIAGEYDLVILDAPPLLGFSESMQIAKSVDGVLLIAKAGSTNTKAVHAMLGTLRRLGAQVVGLVLNQFKDFEGSAYGYGYSDKRPYDRAGR